ncbi:MAG: phosphoribosylanthranilate isomerase [Planctomycetota bacterium]|jgi:phosphoribosylanthranilate isomerase
MQRVRVKICGLREPKQALRVAQMGADAIGLMFAESPRWVSPEQARAITDVLPPMVAAVGVFVDADADLIGGVARRAGLALAQLAGDEPPELLADLPIPAIKGFRVRGADWIDQVRAWLDGVRVHRKLAAVLLDAYDPSARGGTGRSFNWDWVVDARHAGKLAGLPPLILSGGLDASNVEGAIEAVQPWAVDVSTGVESERGVKDLRKVEDFIRATREGAELKSEFWL